MAYNKKHHNVKFQEGDWVLVCSKDLRQVRPSRKLADCYLGPAKIARVVNDVAYKVEIPSQNGLAKVFHVSVLKHFEGSPPTTMEAGTFPDEGPKPISILDKRTIRDQIQWKVTWSDDEVSWEVGDSLEKMGDWARLRDSWTRPPKTQKTVLSPWKEWVYDDTPEHTHKKDHTVVTTPLQDGPRRSRRLLSGAA